MSNPQLSLNDVLYSFALEQPKPTAELIDEYQDRFPQYADAIAEFALELALDALRPDVPDLDAETAAAPPSAEVMRSISHFQNARYHATKERASADASSASNAQRASPINPFNALDVSQFRRLASDVDANLVLVAKLRDRQIVPETIPAAFSQRVAARLGVPVDVLFAHLSEKPRQDFQRVYYKAIDKPTRQPQETFEVAVRTSGLSSEQQERLLEL